MNTAKAPAPGRSWPQASYLNEAGLECPAYSKPYCPELPAMKVLSSLKSAKLRHRDCKIVRRRGKVFVICKSNPRFKARQR